MSAVPVIVAYALRESLRRRVFLVVVVLSVGFLGLYALGASEAFKDTGSFATGAGGVIDAHAFTGATMLGLSMFGTLFLGAVLAVFLTLSTVRGDAERGLLQPLVVRPVGRSTLLGARFLGAAAACALYVTAVYAGCVILTGLIGSWWPDRIATPALELSAAVVLIAAVSLLGSVFLSATANGVAVFMVFGAGLVAGLLGQVGDALSNHTLENVSRVASWLLPFEALYQGALNAITADTGGITGAIVALGPFGGAQKVGPLLGPWAVLYLGLLGLVALRGFERRDL